MKKAVSSEIPELVPGEADRTGLPWPKTWNGAYSLVLASFALWISLLLLLKELCR